MPHDVCAHPCRIRLLCRTVALLVVGLLLAALPPAAASATPAATVTQGPREQPLIALTFDDNYYPSRALSILRILRQQDVPATVFVTGIYVDAYPEITRALVDGGFEIGDHSMTHPYLSRLTWGGMLAEIGGGTDRFRALTGARTAPLMRPPFRATSSRVAEAAGAKGFNYVVLWDVDTNDWRGRSAASIRDNVLRNAHNGSIVLFHLSAPHTAEALPGVISGLRARGYRLVTVSELLKGGRRFADVDEKTPVGQAVLRMNDLGYMAGYNRSYFGPTDGITRAQFSKVGVLIAGIHTPEVEGLSQPTFADVRPVFDASGNPVSYPFDYVEEATAAGLIQGRELTDIRLFDPYNTLTRVQLAQILARMVRTLKGYDADPAAPPAAALPGLGDVPDYALADVQLVASLGLMQGYGSRFDPWATAQRGHVALVMTRFLDLPAYEAPPPAEPPVEPAVPGAEPPAPTVEPEPTLPPADESAGEPAAEVPPPADTGTTGETDPPEDPAPEPPAADPEAAPPPTSTTVRAMQPPAPSTSAQPSIDTQSRAG